MATQAPPSYESVFGTVKSRLPEKPTAQQVFEAVDLLSDNELHAIAIQVQKQTELSPDEQKLFNSKIAEGVASSNQEMKDTGKKVAQACVKVNDMFDNLLKELVDVDAKNLPPPEGPFVPRVRAQQQIYRSLAHESSKWALKIAEYSARFDSVIIPLCKDDRIVKNMKLGVVNDYIKDAESFEKDSKALTDKFTNFKSGFKAFVGTFSNWAKSKLDSENAKLAKLEAELKAMEKTLVSWGTALTVSGIVAGVGFLTVIAIGSLGPVGLALSIVGVRHSSRLKVFCFGANMCRSLVLSLLPEAFCHL